MKEFKLKDVTNLITCGVAKRPEYTQEGVMFLSSQNVKADKLILKNFNYISRQDYERLTKINKPEKGDILYTRVGSFGEATVVDIDEDFAIYVSLTLIKPKREILNSRYLMHYLNSPRVKEFAKNNTRGIGVQNLNVDTVREFDIVIPEMHIQHKIIEILDKAQELIDKRKVQIEYLDKLVKSKFIEMFGELSSNINNFEIVNLESITSKITDGVHSKPEYTTEGVPFISVKDINAGKLEFSECKYISQEAHESYIRRCKPEKGDILYTKVGATYGIPAVVDTDKEFSLYVSVALLKLKKGIVNPVYIKEAMRSIDIKRQADRQVKGIGVPDLHLVEIKKFKVFNPPIDIQNQFADFVNQIDKLKFEMQESLTQLQDNFNSLMQKAFKGELFN